MSYLRMGSDVDIDLTADPELVRKTASLSQQVASTFDAAFVGPPAPTKTTTSKAADLVTKAFASGAAGGASKPARRQVAVASGSKMNALNRSNNSSSTGMRQGFLDTQTVTEMRTAGAPATINKTRWALIVGGALIAGGIAFYAMRKRG